MSKSVGILDLCGTPSATLKRKEKNRKQTPKIDHRKTVARTTTPLFHFTFSAPTRDEEHREKVVGCEGLNGKTSVHSNFDLEMLI